MAGLQKTLEEADGKYTSAIERLRGVTAEDDLISLELSVCVDELTDAFQKAIEPRDEHINRLRERMKKERELFQKKFQELDGELSVRLTSIEGEYKGLKAFKKRLAEDREEVKNLAKIAVNALKLSEKRVLEFPSLFDDDLKS